MRMSVHLPKLWSAEVWLAEKLSGQHRDTRNDGGEEDALRRNQRSEELELSMDTISPSCAFGFAAFPLGGIFGV